MAHRVAAVVVVLSLLVAGESVAHAATPGGLLVSESATRASAVNLAGASVAAGSFAFVANQQNISQISYYLDDPKQTKPIAASPTSILALKLPVGKHTLVAVEILVTGQKQAVSATFTIRAAVKTVAPSKAPASQFLPAAASGKKWSMTFDQEFNGTDYDHTKLTPCFDWNSGDCTKTFNTGREVYKPSQVKVGNGIARLVAEPMTPAVSDKGCFNGKCDYKSGLLSTARPKADDGTPYLYKFTYGYVESRMKISSTPGFFTAFWMLPADPSFDYKYEIDILEQLGWDPTQMFMTYSYNDRADSFTKNSNPTKNGACADKNYGTDFHNIAVDWQPDHIAWYIDGVKCQEFTDASKIANVPMDIIIDMMVDNKWERDWKHTVKAPNTTGEIDVDYLRVFQQK